MYFQLHTECEVNPAKSVFCSGPSVIKVYTVLKSDFVFFFVFFCCFSLFVVLIGLSESEKEAILERLMADVDMQQGAREDERRRQKEILEVSTTNV